MAAVNKNPPAAKNDAKTEKKTPATNGPEVVTEGQVDSQPGPESKAPDGDKPAADPDAPDGDKPASDPDEENDGTTVPGENEGDKVTQNLLERVSVVFLGPYQRYSRGDLAGFSPEYAKQLVERGHACWPKDADKLMKGSAGDEYPYGI